MKTFREKVLAVVQKIPKGTTMTYAQVATHAGNPRAYRIVGSLMKANHNPKIPCHRVVRADGRVGDYNKGGEQVKKKILESEEVQFIK